MIAVPFAEDVDPMPAAQGQHRPSGFKTRRDFQRPAFGVSNKPFVAAPERRHVKQRRWKFFEPGIGRHCAREGFVRINDLRVTRNPFGRRGRALSLFDDSAQRVRAGKEDQLGFDRRASDETRVELLLPVREMQYQRAAPAPLPPKPDALYAQPVFLLNSLAQDQPAIARPVQSQQLILILRPAYESANVRLRGFKQFGDAFEPFDQQVQSAQSFQQPGLPALARSRNARHFTRQSRDSRRLRVNQSGGGSLPKIRRLRLDRGQPAARDVAQQQFQVLQSGRALRLSTGRAFGLSRLVNDLFAGFGPRLLLGALLRSFGA